MTRDIQRKYREVGEVGREVKKKSREKEVDIEEIGEGKEDREIGKERDKGKEGEKRKESKQEERDRE